MSVYVVGDMLKTEMSDLSFGITLAFYLALTVSYAKQSRHGKQEFNWIFFFFCYVDVLRCQFITPKKKKIKKMTKIGTGIIQINDCSLNELFISDSIILKMW